MLRAPQRPASTQQAVAGEHGIGGIWVLRQLVVSLRSPRSIESERTVARWTDPLCTAHKLPRTDGCVSGVAVMRSSSHAATSAAAARQVVTTSAVALSKNTPVFHSSQLTAADAGTMVASAMAGAVIASTSPWDSEEPGETAVPTVPASVSAMVIAASMMSPAATAGDAPAARSASLWPPSRYPVAGTPRASCHSRIAARVRGPKRPSDTPGSKPSFSSPC